MASTQSEPSVNPNGNNPGLAVTSIGGVSVTKVSQPASAAELGELLAIADRDHLTVAPMGGGTHMGIGNAPASIDRLISTTSLNTILAYEPPDMTLSVEAGAKLADIQRTLSEHGQGLPIEVGDPERATIGGILAAAMYGPKRFGWGTLRDYLIGINVAYAGGSIAKAGGMVVKNVSGFDLMRMHHGALGTLGIIVSANFKVLPGPRSERTVTMLLDSLERVAHVREVVLAGRATPSAFEVIVESGAISAAIRIEGRDRTTEVLARELTSAIGAAAKILDPDASAMFWIDYGSGFDSSDTPNQWWLRSRVKPGESLTFLSAVALMASESGMAGSRLSCSPGLGFVDLRGDASGANEPQFQALVERMRAHCPRTSIVAASSGLKRGIDVWGESVDSLDLMRSLKNEFDPNAILNPGRYVGGM